MTEPDKTLVDANANTRKYANSFFFILISPLKSLWKLLYYIGQHSKRNFLRNWIFWETISVTLYEMTEILMIFFCQFLHFLFSKTDIGCKTARTQHRKLIKVVQCHAFSKNVSGRFRSKISLQVITVTRSSVWDSCILGSNYLLFRTVFAWSFSGYFFMSIIIW